MKISKSKQELARIISENGGWLDGYGFSAQDGDDCAVWFYEDAPVRGGDAWWATSGLGHCGIEDAAKLPNWHQTILSRDEYFHLYQAPDADGWIEWKGGYANPVEFGVLVDVKLANGEVLNRVSANSGAEWRHCWGDTNIIAYRLHKPEIATSAREPKPVPVPEAKPTIEQLAADYHNAKDYADRKQQEADDANADADAKLKALEIAGGDIGMLLSPITEKQEPELAAAVKVGDEVECVESNTNRDKYNGMAGTVLEVDDSSTPYLVDFGGSAKIWCHEVKFIRRP